MVESLTLHFSGDGYVHRLIASKTRGHLVELPHPSRRRGEGDGAKRDAKPGSERQTDDPGAVAAAWLRRRPPPVRSPESEDEEEMANAVVGSKLDAVGLEYNQLLASQLESQARAIDARASISSYSHPSATTSPASSRPREPTRTAPPQPRRLQRRAPSPPPRSQAFEKASQKRASGFVAPPSLASPTRGLAPLRWQGRRQSCAR
jgi:hypothetical protein